MSYRGLSPEERYYYAHLDELAKAQYLRMLDNFQRLDFSYSYRNSEEMFASFRAFEAIRWDYPELFPIQMSLGVGITEENADEYYIENEDGSTTTVMGTYYTKEETQEILAKLDAVYHEFDGITDPFELELAAYRYAIEHFEYEHHDDCLPEKEYEEIFTVAGLMRNGRGVCAAYTRFIQYILQRRGIPAVAILQNTEQGNDESGHAWLAVQIDGEYYHLDTTFDEGDEKDPECFPYIHFNVTDSEIAEDRDFDSSIYPDIICRATAANYYHRRGLYFMTDEEAIEGARRFARESEPTDKEELYFYFRMPPGHQSDELIRRLPAELRGHTLAKWIETARDVETGRYYVQFGYTMPKTENAE